MQAIGLLILRVGLGVFMMKHGWGKVDWVMNGIPEGKSFDPIGMGDTASLICATAAELGGGLLVILGLLTRFASLSIAFTMGVAAFVVHAEDGWSGKEPALIFLFGFACLVFTGAGAISIDAKLFGGKKSDAGEIEPS